MVSNVSPRHIDSFGEDNSQPEALELASGLDDENENSLGVPLLDTNTISTV